MHFYGCLSIKWTIANLDKATQIAKNLMDHGTSAVQIRCYLDHLLRIKGSLESRIAPLTTDEIAFIKYLEVCHTEIESFAKKKYEDFK